MRRKIIQPYPVQNLQGQFGISLIESMVAIVVMALGILGILGVQMRTLADTQTSVRRAQAVLLIEDLSERIQVNPNGLGNLDYYVSPWKAELTNKTCSNCNAEELALRDVEQWKKSVKDNLPLSDAYIFLAADDTVANNRRQLGVMISWRENERTKPDGTKDKDFTNILMSIDTGAAKVSCPDNSTCHLQYIQPSSRCIPYPLGGEDNPQLFCP